MKRLVTQNSCFYKWLLPTLEQHFHSRQTHTCLCQHWNNPTQVMLLSDRNFIGILHIVFSFQFSMLLVYFSFLCAPG